MVRRVTRRWTAGLTAVALGVTVLGGASAAAEEVTVIVGATSAAEAASAVSTAGGEVTIDLDYLGAVVAEVTEDEADRLRVAGYEVALDEAVELSEVVPVDTNDVALPAPQDQYDAMNLPDLTGAGTRVALVDSGVNAIGPLEGRVTGLPMEGGRSPLEDLSGHGTFMAGLINGVAPDAEIVSVNVADEQGEVSVSRVLQGIGEVIRYGEDTPIDVLNLSIGADVTRSPKADPLVAAAEAAWAAGITVVTAAGNDDAEKGIHGDVVSPGRSPWVITVGATDLDHDAVADFSRSGRVTGIERPDVLAPGTSVVSLRSPGTPSDASEEGIVDGERRRGTGTSMSTALVSGAAALLSQERGLVTPDDVKAALVATATPVDGSTAGLVNVTAADALEPDELTRQVHPGAKSSVKGMPWARPDAPPASVTWERFRWMDGEWERFRWMDGDWERLRWMDGQWQRFRWMDGSWERLRWMDDDTWQRFRWMEEDWQRLRWMDVDTARLRWMDANLQRFRWMDTDWSRLRWMASGDTQDQSVEVPTTWDVGSAGGDAARADATGDGNGAKVGRK